MRGLLLGLALLAIACDHSGATGHDGGGDDDSCPPPSAAGAGQGDATGSADALVPAPRSLVLEDGQFALTAESAILVHDDAARAVAGALRERLARATGYSLPRVSDETCAGSLIELVLDPAITEPEGYALHVTPERATLSAGTPDGLARGVATLRQLFAAEIESDSVQPRARWLVPALRIEDAPAFSYRGVHLDVSRHFFALAFVERYVDLLAAYKLNVFHFHLTDDQGWRIEIKKYPLLTQVGAVRHEAGGDYGGFYSQDELRELVAYAAARGVTIVPEIEMPGHATAALAAYPEYACIPGPIQVPSTWGVFENVYCPSDETFAFLEDVLDEVMAIFPSPYVHIGGDEVSTAQWQASPVAQEVVMREGLGSVAGLQGYFMRRIEAYLRAHGRTAIGWDEILAAGVPASTAVMAWRDAGQGRAAAEQGHDVVMTPNQLLYFDHYQGDPASEPPAIGGYITVADVYGFDPVPPGLAPAAAPHILGAQANLWSEYVASEAHAEYMLLPRAIALAEVLWSGGASRDYAGFVARLAKHVAHLDAAGVSYAKQALAYVARSPYGGSPHALPGTLEAEDYDDGGEGIAYHDSGFGNTPGQYRHDDVDIEATSGGGHDVAYVEPGEWLEYTVAASAGSYRLSLRAATLNAGAALRVSVDGDDVSGAVAVPSTGAWDAFVERSGPMVTLPAGTHIVRVSFEGAGCNLDWLRLVP